jgi:hypothetical protein
VKLYFIFFIIIILFIYFVIMGGEAQGKLGVKLGVADFVSMMALPKMRRKEASGFSLV